METKEEKGVGMEKKNIKAPEKNQELLTKYVGRCPKCKKENEALAHSSRIPKYCRFCGARVYYSNISESKPSSKNDDV